MKVTHERGELFAVFLQIMEFRLEVIPFVPSYIFLTVTSIGDIRNTKNTHFTMKTV